MNIVCMMAEREIVLLENVRDVPGALVAVPINGPRSHQLTALHGCQREMIAFQVRRQRTKWTHYLDSLRDLVSSVPAWRGRGQYKNRQSAVKEYGRLWNPGGEDTWCLNPCRFGNTPCLLTQSKATRTDDVWRQSFKINLKRALIQLAVESKIEAKEKQQQSVEERGPN
ncbi:hypothetical protein TYRP_008492 [Tyrophagus putrescentiae]|nr:hypothetical protein TYRP_008492 [Tyrophagus putrescentiae]